MQCVRSARGCAAWVTRRPGAVLVCICLRYRNRMFPISGQGDVPNRESCMLNGGRGGAQREHFHASRQLRTPIGTFIGFRAPPGRAELVNEAFFNESSLVPSSLFGIPKPKIPATQRSNYRRQSEACQLWTDVLNRALPSGHAAKTLTCRGIRLMQVLEAEVHGLQLQCRRTLFER
jgi:hypothetical protein